MNPYNTNNTNYNYSQQTPGPPQPQWQAPPRRGWGDPRLQQQQPTSPVSPYGQTLSNAFGPPLPPPPPPPLPTQQSQYDTTAWGVRFNQGLAPQPYEEKPPLPPRPESAAGRISPQPGQGHGHNHSQSLSYAHQPPAASTTTYPSTQQYATSWGDPYQANSSPQQANFPPPPPPPPRPAEYQSQAQAQAPVSGPPPPPPPPVQPPYNRVNTPHQEYSHHPPSHHYDPAPQHQWGPPQPAGPSYYPTAPPAAQVSATVDAPLVSPIEGSNVYWGHQGHGSTAGQKTHDKPNQSQALSFGGPSDWEHYESNPPSETPTSPAAPAVAPFYHDQLAPSPAPTPAPAAVSTSHTPVSMIGRPPSPVEIGVNSPVTPRKDSRTYPQPSAVQPPPVVEERPSSSGHPSSVRSDSLNTNGNIDSVIQAWTSPLRPTHPPDQTARPESRTSGRVASPEPSPTAKVVDPYADLEPEFKASLKRYGAMLRKESAAETDEAKFDIFQAFVKKELRLRSLLYGIELPKENATPVEAKPAEAAKAIESVKQEKPVIEHPRHSVVEPASKPAPVLTPAPAPTKPVEAPRPEPPQAFQPPRPSAPPVVTKPALEERRPSKDESFVLVDSGGNEEGEYSPGGRPRMAKKPPVTTAQLAIAVDPFPPRGQSLPKKPDADALSPSINAPMVIDDYRTPGPPSPGVNAPILVLPEMAPPSGASGTSTPGNKPTKPIKFEPARPAYTPFRYSAATQEEKPKALQPADKAYSSLRHSVIDSGRLMKADNLIPPTRPATASGRREHEEAFIGLIRQQSMAVRQKTPGPGGIPGAIRPGGADAARRPPPPSMRVGTPANAAPKDPLKQAVTGLRSVLPIEAPPATPIEGPGHPKLKIVKAKVDGVLDEFGFIHAKVVEWDKTNKEVRKEQDAERHARQVESEAHIDGLFNDNEIGYADIGDLEAEFKLAEAERRFRENQEELESFTAQVFNPVTERLQKEIAELMTAYTLAIDLLDLESEPVSRLLKGNNEKPRMSDVMTCVLALFNKIEVRHQKVAEAQVERERRRKHLELTVLYTNGDTTGVKTLEKDFAVAEKLQVLHEARGKDNRANKLMDSFDRATVRGLGDNQTFIDDLLTKLQELKKITNGDASQNPDSSKNLYEKDGARDTLTLAQEVVNTVITDSRRLLALSNEADVLLNESDFGVSVAEARTANADSATYAKLESEKAKEDAKLVEEMNTRVNSVNKSPADALALIRELVDGIGSDPDHKDRMKKALEAAKQRNS